MKKLIIFSIALCSLCSTQSFAQMQGDPLNKPFELMTCDEADAKIKQLRDTINARLEAKLKDLSAQYASKQKELTASVDAKKKCDEDLYVILGANKNDVENFRQRLGVLKGKVREMQKLENDVLADRRDDVKKLEDELNAMRKEKIAVLPEFYDQIVSTAKDIKGLYRERSVKYYVVGTWEKDRDCLWNIAEKTDLKDPFAWPKIWQNNTDQIRNPDIIHPGQKLTMPKPGPKTPDEMKAERKYWRKKNAAMEAKTDAAPAEKKN